MGSGFFYSGPANTKKNVKRNRFVRSFLFAGMLLISMPIVSMAKPPNTPPVYLLSSPQTVQVCENSTGVDISSYLTINDPDVGQTETWSVVGSGPLNGSVAPISYAASSSGGNDTVAPNSLIYTPNPGFTGIDTFTIQVTDGIAVANMFFMMSVNLPPSLTPAFGGVMPAVCMGATSTTLAFSGLSGAGPTTVSFSAVQTAAVPWQVPSGVSSIRFDASGGVGGNDSKGAVPAPGKGGRVQGALTVTPGQELYITVGSSGSNGSITGATGGFNGGGNAFYYSPIAGCGGAGGGASDIRIGGTSLTNRVIVAGGGGGSGWDLAGELFGGGGGNNSFGVGGSSANNDGGTHANGGSQSGGGLPATYAGWLPGMAGALGTGGNGSVQGISGGGGAGYYGGGGGVWTGGAGGASYANAAWASSVTHTQGYNNGDGSITFNYVVPGTYTIQWGADAVTAGFSPTVTGALPSSPISVAIPAGAAPNTYYGTLYIANTLCESQGYPISVVVNPIPDVAVVPGQVFCNGDDSTTGAVFTNVTPGTYPATVFTWTNSNTAIGIEDTGRGNILSFTATNATALPITSNITVTPIANSCSGTSTTFTVTVNPTPTLTVATVSPICNYGPFLFGPTSGTPGTSFLWTAKPTTGAVIQIPSGSDNPDDSITNTTANTVIVPFVYTLAANSCINSQTVNVSVLPTPELSSPLTGSVCSGNTFSYNATSLTPGVSYTWSRVFVAGVTPATGSGSTSNITETLGNTDPATAIVQYVFTNTITVGGTTCSNQQNVSVSVNPLPALTGSPYPPAALCSGTDFNEGLFTPTSIPGTSFAWSRALTPGISNPAGSGINSPDEVLNNSTPNPVAVVYTYTLTFNGCPNLQYVTVTVNPIPKLITTPPLAFSVCDSALVSYNPSSLTAATTFIWQRNAVVGISNFVGSSTGNPMEYLYNTTALPIVDTYYYTLTANGCSNSQNVVVTVNPKPVFSALSLTAAPICDSTVFSFPTTSSTPGVTYSWYRPYVPGIYAAAETGINSPDQELINSTNVIVPVVYIYTLTVNGCTNVQNVTVIVEPTPRLTSSLTGSFCSGSEFSYNPTSFTPGATFSWDRPATLAIPGSGFGVGSVNETLTSPGLTPVTVQYEYRLGVGSCINLGYQTVNVVIDPTPPAPSITITSPSTVCLNTLYQNFGALSAPASGIDYTWSATNATIFATAANGQNVIINFNSAGNAVVTLSANVNGYSCYRSSSKTVSVSNSGADVVPVVVYNNGQFICLQNNNQSYQWGYDDLTTLQSVVLTGEINQNYDNSNPDLYHKHYWVITVTEGCMQKAYYDDPPTGIANLTAGGTNVKVFPNPATDNISVEVSTTVTGNIQVEVLNMLGQRLMTQALVDNKADFNVESLPAGNYLVGCYLNGVKVANAKFTKN